MKYLICGCVGYGLGCLNPAYFISKWKHQDIKNTGTGNLGTTNTFINFGKRWGCFVLLFDMFKAFAAVKICGMLFPGLMLAEVVAGCMAVIGHIFPFYTGFKGGKGIASFAGFVLSVEWKLFLMLLIVGCIMAVVVNYGCGISFSATILFPVIYSYEMHSVQAFLLLSVCSAVIIYKHMDNIKKIKDGKEMPVRQFLRNYIFKEKSRE